MGLINGALEGDSRAIARLATHIERDTPLGREALKTLYPRSGGAHRIGITGPPGAGKSTLVDGLIGTFRRSGQRVAVLAVDPSSELSGGATLGDRIRMERWYMDDNVFIRSVACRGAAGGLARSTIGLAHLFDALGFDPILIETVGVGQNEQAIASQSHTTILVQVAGMGDSVQFLKAGIVEIGDILAVNKADRPGSKDLVQDLRSMINLSNRDAGDWTPNIVETVATDGTGLPALESAIQRHRDWLESGNGLERRTFAIAKAELSALISSELEKQVHQRTRNSDLRQVISEIALRKQSSLEVVSSIKLVE
ncbi:MAG: methylmalonyl Co-A mutase-associated GTPase MeaB [Chloroflexota bacterium]|nr:methylmalonyl Co-A mutase-associated GTPase MeaB [Chloroflexota bacterium]